jgi:hypothetical protein
MRAIEVNRPAPYASRFFETINTESEITVSSSPDAQCVFGKAIAEHLELCARWKHSNPCWRQLGVDPTLLSPGAIWRAVSTKFLLAWLFLKGDVASRCSV